MNIQAISFGANQKQLKTKPYISPDKMQASSITLETAIEQIEEKQLASMAQQAKQAQNTASTTIQEASKQFKKEASSILYQAGKIQQKSEEIMAEIIDTSAYNAYLKRNEHMPFDSYMTQVELKDGLYDINISQHRITATKTKESGKDIYVFDTTDRSLTSYIENQKNIGYARTAEAEYFFDGNEGLTQCNIKPSRSEYELVSKRFKFNTDRKENTLSGVSIMAKTALDNESAERIFEYDKQGNLIRYIHGFRENVDCVVSTDLLYEFYDNELSAFKKASVEAENFSAAKLYAEFINKDTFYVLSGYNADKTPEYNAICYYQNGKIEGSII